MDDYPLLDLMLTMLWLYLFIAWFWLLISLMADVFRSRDLSGGKKALWTLVLIFFSFIGAVAYLITRGGGMAERAAKDREEFIQRHGGVATVSTADELSKLASLRDSGALTEEEFAAQKSRVLAT